MGGTALEQCVERAAETALAQQRYVSAIDVFLGLGWLAPPHLDNCAKAGSSAWNGSAGQPAQAVDCYVTVPPLGAATRPDAQ